MAGPVIGQRRSDVFGADLDSTEHGLKRERSEMDGFARERKAWEDSVGELLK